MTKRNILPKGVRLFLCASGVMNLIGLGCEAVARWWMHLPYPYSNALLDEQPVPDLRNFAEAFQHLHTPEFFSLSYPVPFMYPAPMAPLYSLFLRLPHRFITFEVTLAAILVLCASGFVMYLERNTSLNFTQSLLTGLGALLLSYPAYFELKQGNMEIFVCLVVGAGVWLYLHNRWHMSAAFFGLAISMKIFPFVYLGLFISKRRYRPVLTAMGSAAVITIASLYYTYPSLPVAERGIGADLAHYRHTVPEKMRREIGFDHSIFAATKLAVARSHKLGQQREYSKLLSLYLPVAAVAGLAVFWFRIRKLPITNQVLCLCIASILLPPVSYDYTLLHLYVPWAMLVVLSTTAVEKHSRPLRMLFFLLALLTSIETELIHGAFTVSGQFKAVVLLLTLGVALRYPLSREEEKYVGDRDEGAKHQTLLAPSL